MTKQESLDDLIKKLTALLLGLEAEERIDAINKIKLALREKSPMKGEPVDCVIWVKNDAVHANNYNPNSVAPAEFRLLEHSIQADGYTQPIVVFREENGSFEVVDGFHRNRVGKESAPVRSRVRGRLPIAVINEARGNKADRIAATIRHNRARGRHGVGAMSDIVLELARRNWSNEKIADELGMCEDEVLRLKQISGLAEAFANRDFSEAWEAT